ncbi:MAG: hypothetical protein ACLFMY_02135 [Guyparkeria sp.]|uniref:hypothetical protein n=1 Tax=Guyparkeria sp. TaxID=2035736 RepID=UPI00397C8899
MVENAATEEIAGSAERRLSSQPRMIEGAAWVRDAWTQLDRLVSAGRLPHGLLLHGRLGSTMTALVETLARRLICEAPRDGWPCGACPACRQAEQGSFPDVHRLADDPDHRDIPIDAIRDLIEGAWFTRYGRMRLIVIERIERLNRNSGNALLKLLEEPPEATQFLCTVEHVDRLLPTIRSRLQRLRLREPRQAELADWWQAARGLAPEQARLAAFVDDPALLEEGELTFDWQAVTRAWVDLMAGRGNPVGVIEPWLSLPRPALARWLLRLWAAVARGRAGLPTEVPAALEASVEQLARSHDDEHWLAVQSRLVRFAREAGHPLHPELAVEQLALDLVDPRLPRRLDPGL